MYTSVSCLCRLKNIYLTLLIEQVAWSCTGDRRGEESVLLFPPRKTYTRRVRDHECSDIPTYGWCRLGVGSDQAATGSCRLRRRCRVLFTRFGPVRASTRVVKVDDTRHYVDDTYRPFHIANEKMDNVSPMVEIFGTGL